MELTESIIDNFQDNDTTISLVPISSIRDELERRGNDAYKKILTPWEYSYFNNIKIMKRKCDFLSGRLAAKKAVNEHLIKKKGHGFNHYYLNLEDIEIKRLESGKPSVKIKDKKAKLEISISHSSEFAISMVCNIKCCKGIGIDIERVEKREESFLDVAFNSSEIVKLKNTDISESRLRYYEYITWFWSIKESVLKSLGIGLNVDIKDIEIVDLTSTRQYIKMRNEVMERYELLDGQDINIKSCRFNSHIISISYFN